MDTSTDPVIIAGAGIGGLACATALRQRGIDVTIYERADAVRGLSGSGLTIWGNAMSALQRLGLGEAMNQIGSPLERQVAMTESGSIITDVPVGEFQRAAGAVGVGVRRQELLTTLLRGAEGATIHYERGLAGVRQETDRAVALLDDGSEVAAPIVVGADGLRSVVREELLGDGPPEPLSHMVWRGIGDGLGPFPANTSMMVYGPGAVRMVSWPVGGDGVCWSIGRNGRADRSRRPPETIRDELLELIAAFPEACRHAVASTPPERILRTDLFARRKLEPLVDGRVALLGDAAHAMPTVFGQGAAMALEDAVVLADAVAGNRDDPCAGLREYEQRRMPRLHWVRSQVFKVSGYQEWESPVLCAMRNSFMRALPASATRAMWTKLMTFDVGAADRDLAYAR